jgi:CRISPR system Cascade subunit CasD
MRLRMGVRVDRGGTSGWDYHTAGARIGIRKAEGGIKKTASTGEYETLISKREYLYDASFLVALLGAADTISDCASKMEDPVWPIYLGRKCCIPAEPVFVATGLFETLTEALSSVSWCPRISAIDWRDRRATRILDTFIEHSPGSPPPAGARLVFDEPRAFGYNSQGPRWVIAGQVTVPVGDPIQALPYRPDRHDPYGCGWDALRRLRLEHDNDLCVFCKSPAVDVHHVDYGDARVETLRSMCKLCHDACTMLEYGDDMHQLRVDPSDPNQRMAILRQIEHLLAGRRLGRRRELLEAGRSDGANFLDEMPTSWAREGR